MSSCKVLDQYVSRRVSLYHGDSVEILKGLPDNSIHYSLFSPPFSSLYTYSNSDRDMGNSTNDAQFYTHFGYLIQELARVLMPGRLVSVHCMDIPKMKSRDGVIGLKDFPGWLGSGSSSSFSVCFMVSTCIIWQCFLFVSKPVVWLVYLYGNRRAFPDVFQVVLHCCARLLLSVMGYSPSLSF